MSQMPKANKYTIPRRRASNNRSAYSAPGITPPGNKGKNPGTVFVPSAATAVQTYLQPSEADAPEQSSASNDLAKDAPRTILKCDPSPTRVPEVPVIGSSGERLLNEIMKEMVNNPLEQEEETYVSPILSPPLEHSISFHPWESKLWVNYKTPVPAAQDEEWPDYRIKNNEILNPPGLGRSSMLPDELFERKNEKVPEPVKIEPEAIVAPATRAFRMQPLVNPLLQKPTRASPKKSGAVAGRSQGWKPPPAFVPGVPFQANTLKPAESQENLPITQLPLGRDRGYSHASSGQVSGTSTDLVRARSSSQAAHMEPYPEGYLNAPGPRHSKSEMTFRPAHASAVASEATTAQAHAPAMRGSQSMTMARASNHTFQVEPRVSVNQELTNEMRVRMLVPGYYPLPRQQQNVVKTGVEHHLHQANAGDPSSSSSLRHRSASNNAPQILHATRGVYIRGLPSNITMSQLCANIRGGTIERLSIISMDDDKRDAAVFFISTEAAKIYKHFTNSVGGIWWNPKEHHNAFPSFTAFVGPECGGHDRLPDTVRKAIERDGATRSIVVFGIPDILSIDGILQRLQRSLYPHQVEIESFSDGTAGRGGSEKRASVFNFTSIIMAIRARRYFMETAMFKDAVAHFSPDECAGSMNELSAKWNKDLHASNLMRASRRNLHGEYALGVNEMVGRGDGAGLKKRS